MKIALKSLNFFFSEMYKMLHMKFIVLKKQEAILIGSVSYCAVSDNLLHQFYIVAG